MAIIELSKKEINAVAGARGGPGGFAPVEAAEGILALGREVRKFFKSILSANKKN